MTCQSSGRSPTVAIGLGPVVVLSRMRMPRPPQNKTTFTVALLSNESYDPELGNREHELAAPRAHVFELFADFLAQIPREHEDVIGLRLRELLGRVDRNVRARQELALFHRAAVDGVREQVAANAAVVEQRVAFARRAVAHDRLAESFGIEQELHEVVADRRDRTSEADVSVDGVEADALFVI